MRLIYSNQTIKQFMQSAKREDQDVNPELEDDDKRYQQELERLKSFKKIDSLITNSHDSSESGGESTFTYSTPRQAVNSLFDYLQVAHELLAREYIFKSKHPKLFV